MGPKIDLDWEILELLTYKCCEVVTFASSGMAEPNIIFEVVHI